MSETVLRNQCRNAVSTTVLARLVLSTSLVAAQNQEQKEVCHLLIQVEPKEVGRWLALLSKDGIKSVALASLAQTLAEMTSSPMPNITDGNALEEGSKVTYDESADERSGKMRADNVLVMYVYQDI